MDNDSRKKNGAKLTDQSKTVSLFQFIRELNKIKHKAILNVKNHPWTYSLSDLPDDPENIQLNYRDRVEDGMVSEDVNGENVILSIRKPEFQNCPEPDELFKDWLLPGWDSYQNEAIVREYIETEPKNDGEVAKREFFTDNAERAKRYEIWLSKRPEWIRKQRITESTRNLFADLYRYYFELQREFETEEIIVANGSLCDSNNTEIQHPVLTHRVKIEYDADSNVVSILDTDTPSELYSVVFQVMNDVNHSGIKELSEKLQENDYHPLDRNDTPDFLKTLVYQLSSSSYYSDKPLTAGQKTNSRLLLYLDPCFIVRKRLDGTLKAIERIIEDVKETRKVPKPIIDIVSGGTIDIPEDNGEIPVEERLAAVGGESIDILLSKEANKEQLDIAKRIEKYNAVVVQGPPGTGKTHTIANLMGHFFAQGKSVLVTSYTKKALRVLKEKVAPGLQSLCVSMLDDSNADMERSVDGITRYMSKTTSSNLKDDMDHLATERREVISKLADVRKKIYAIIYQECNCIVLNGEDISPSEAARFVVEHSESFSYIPGNVRLYVPMPLTFEQLNALYRSNEGISLDDETELATDLPDPTSILDPSEFNTIRNQLLHTLKQIEEIQSKNAWTVHNSSLKRVIQISGKFGEFDMPYPRADAIENLKTYAQSFGKIDKWMRAVAVDGKSGNTRLQRWQVLIDDIKNACSCADGFLAQSLGKTLDVDKAVPLDTIKSAFEQMRPIFAKKGKISKFDFMFHKNFEPALNAVSIRGNRPDSAEDCDLVLKYIELQENRAQCSAVWNDLLAKNDVPAFIELDGNEPERIAANWIPQIQKYLRWYSTDYQLLISKLSSVDIPSDILFQKDILDSDLVATDKILTCVEHIIPQICDIAILTLKTEAYQSSLKNQKAALTSGKRGNSKICQALVSAMKEGSETAYTEAYMGLKKMYEKYELQKNRNEALTILEPVAPQWAEAIRTRQGIHGSFTVPNDIDQAWKWKQLNGIIAEITQKSFAELQAESLRLSREYRNVTAEYAEKSGWYHLLKRTEADISMKQALEGWRLTVKRIGKGTGKSAPKYKAKARELMTKCQKAVPGWIMPINKALESLDPCANKFDIIIIDEASQADISSLAILYMGEKLIIVGDDKQVSPMAVGVEDNKINSLQEQYIKDKIPNAHLYTAKASIYDIARTTFQPLMLREHFRCVPEIIGFSNMLSYDGKIKPLRDASNSVLLPAVVNYRVADGQKVGNTNPKEAKTIVALMQACFNQPEYDGKTFGVISLLGDEQVKLIQQEIEKTLEPQDIIGRSVLCGNSANFQGDERDVIFLSLVESGKGTGPIRKLESGQDDTYRKRYNVAASRARDQLWVINSLDPANDLKPGDIRKKLIDYSLDPKASKNAHAVIEKKADSPFEVAVATALSNRGYHLEQQWEVGSYRLDIVAICGENKVAIECDGERWHSSEEKIREDMERQTILERLGWRFIRIRGSEFYRDNETTIDRVIAELKSFGIEPEDTTEHKNNERDTDLLQRVKIAAADILNKDKADHPEQDMTTIEAALDPKALDLTTEPKKVTKNIKEKKDASDVKVPEIKIATMTITKPDLPKPVMKPVISANSILQQIIENHFVSPAGSKNSQPVKVTSDIPKQMTIPVISGLGKTSSKKMKGDEFIKDIQNLQIELIDNRAQSGIVWVLYCKEKKELIENVISKYKYKVMLEKRGAIATGNRPAWRVMI